ncbi:MAG: hypothetical protein NTX75_16840 [Proteobacteria bacterium]|nr:hypothetical protein [Pseudomonadota bacterium]
MHHDEILLIHLGGLGDMCLSESTFLSLSAHFNKNIVALGYTRFLRLFEGYFKRIERIESARWLPLFSQYTPDITWERIIFIGKDREGALREKWGRMSREPMIFIEMYPEEQGSRVQGVIKAGFEGSRVPGVGGKEKGELRIANCEAKYHVEDFQLMQLGQYGIEAKKKEITPNLSRRVILYPEKGFKKEKWHYENFVRLYHSLKSKGIDVHMLKSMGLETDVKEAVFFEELTEVRAFFEKGGIFVSNDSGMAHLAGMCGLHTITIFNDFDPDIWRPRGSGITFRYGKDRVDVPFVTSKILEAIENNARRDTSLL